MEKLHIGTQPLRSIRNLVLKQASKFLRLDCGGPA
jgi:hypothetical protein